MNEKQIAEKMIADANKMIAEAERRLAKLDKPELRHGDYGYHRTSGNPYLHIDGATSGTYLVAPEGGYPLCRSNGEYQFAIGNIFDDLKRNSKDLEEFEERDMKWRVNGRFIEVDIPYYNKCDEADCSGNINYIFNIKEMVSHHQRIGQLIAFAQREQASK